MVDERQLSHHHTMVSNFMFVDTIVIRSTTTYTTTIDINMTGPKGFRASRWIALICLASLTVNCTPFIVAEHRATPRTTSPKAKIRDILRGGDGSGHPPRDKSSEATSSEKSATERTSSVHQTRRLIWRNKKETANENQSEQVPMSYKKRNLLRSRFKFCALFVSVALLTIYPQGVWAATAAALSDHTFGPRNVARTFVLLGSLAIFPMTMLGVSPLAKRLSISASRCALQVFFLGSVLLQRMMLVTNPIFVALWIFGVGLIAGNEASSRIEYSYPSMQRDVCLAVLFGGTSVLALTKSLSILGELDPWYRPMTWIPIAGMLFGNTLSASSLGAASVTKQFVTLKGPLELRLARGASAREAISPLVQETLTTALTPTINGLAVTGIVHIPGMMTGQILAGQPPQQAAAYQVMINFLIATTACATVQLVTASAIRKLVDFRGHRIKSDLLGAAPKKRSGKGSLPGMIVSAWRQLFGNSNEEDGELKDATEGTRPPAQQKVAVALSSSGSSNAATATAQTVFEAKDLFVDRANILVSMSLKPGDRVGISGRSGAGKSQILRTLAGLEEQTSGDLMLHTESVSAMSVPEYRRKVCYVPQITPALEGTPRSFYEDILSFRSNRELQNGTLNSPIEWGKKWGLEESTFDQRWSTLSGGQAQRVSLAIAMSLDPEVLLLDEPTSALDEKTSKMVEESLLESGKSIVIVSHSPEQLKRLCSHQLDLD